MPKKQFSMKQAMSIDQMFSMTWVTDVLSHRNSPPKKSPFLWRHRSSFTIGMAGMVHPLKVGGLARRTSSVFATEKSSSKRAHQSDTICTIL